MAPTICAHGLVAANFTASIPIGPRPYWRTLIFPKRFIRSALPKAQVRQQSVQPSFASKPAFLVTTERAGRIKFVVGVCPDHAGAQLVHHFEDFAALIGPDAGAKSVRRIIGSFESFLRRAECHDAEHRAKNFLLGHAAGGRDAG